MASMDLSPEQVASAREQWVALGKDGGQFDAAMGIKPADSAAVPVDRTSGSLSGERFTDEQALVMADDLVKHGADPAAVAAALARDGVTRPTDERSLEEKGRDADFGFGEHRTEADYRIDAADLGIVGMPAPNQVQWLREAKTFALDLQLEPALASALLSDLARTAFAIDRMNEAERADWDQAQLASLARMFKDDTAKINEEVGFALSLAGNQDFVQKIIKSGAMSAFVKATLANHARAVKSWRGKA